ncbi:hypothetical protein [Kaistella palustris]|uniref:hypothetical protein n=1 Tax=Kaistella palustris TaxID=493376 RepID=UPI0003FA4DD7|nr:hypothetical protein [Kaistella palustris]
MLSNIQKRKWIVLGFAVWSVLNLVAYQLLTNSPDYQHLIEHANNDALRKSLAQKQVFSDVFPAVVLTIDIVGILFLLFLFLKFIFKSLKNSTPK